MIASLHARACAQAGAGARVCKRARARECACVHPIAPEEKGGFAWRERALVPSCVFMCVWGGATHLVRLRPSSLYFTPFCRIRRCPVPLHDICRLTLAEEGGPNRGGGPSGVEVPPRRPGTERSVHGRRVLHDPEESVVAPRRPVRPQHAVAATRAECERKMGR